MRPTGLPGDKGSRGAQWGGAGAKRVLGLRLTASWCRAAGSSVAFSAGNLSTSSSASSTLGSPENEEYILSFETIDKMRRVSSYSALNSLIGESCQQAEGEPGAQ